MENKKVKPQNNWIYLGFMFLGALAFYQMMSGDNSIVYLILIILTVGSFLLYYKQVDRDSHLD